MLRDKPLAQVFQVRHFTVDDVYQVLQLMKGLAAFEGYLAEFNVTEADLISRGLREIPEFFACVAEADDKTILGMAVYYLVPYTYDLQPDMILKELFVADEARGLGVGQALMDMVRTDSLARGCGQIKWLVLKGNEAAKRFYSSLGARENVKWENWYIKLNHEV